MAFCGKRKGNENSNPSKRLQTNKVCKFQKNKCKIWRMPPLRDTKILHYSSWVLDREFLVYIRHGLVSSMIKSLQKMFHCPCDCEDSVLLQLELDLLLSENGLSLLVEEEIHDRERWAWNSFVIGDLQSMTQQEKVSDKQVRQRLLYEWTKGLNDKTNEKTNGTKHFLGHNQARKSFYFSPCLYLEWQLCLEVQRDGFLPYNLYDPIPKRNPRFDLIAWEQQHEDLVENKWQQEKMQTKNGNVWFVLFANMQFLLPTTMIEMIWMYLPSKFVSELEEKTCAWEKVEPNLFYPDYAMITHINQLDGGIVPGKLRHIDIHKINHPIDTVRQIFNTYNTNLYTNLYKRREEHILRSPSYTFVLCMTVRVPKVAFTCCEEWSMHFSLEEWILWSMMQELATRYQDTWVLPNGIRMKDAPQWNDKLMLFYMEKGNPVFLQTCLELQDKVIRYLQQLSPYDIQHVNETHAFPFLPMVREEMKQWRAFPTSSIYECKRSEWSLSDIYPCSVDHACANIVADVFAPMLHKKGSNIK